jgi:HEAT repeat protein
LPDAELRRRLLRLCEDVRARAEELLAALGVETSDDLHRVLETEDAGEEALVAAGWLLGQLGDRRSSPPRLGRLLWRARTDDVRLAAANALMLLGGLRARRELRRALDLSPDAHARQAAAWALGFAGRVEEDTPRLVRALADAAEDAQVRAHAAEALGHLLEHHPLRLEPIPRLLAALDDASPHVRFWSCFALGCLADEDAVPALAALAARDRARVPGWWSVRREALWAIEQIHTRGPE